MAREGARLIVADIEAETAEATVAAINEAGGQAIAQAGDLTVAAEVAALVGCRHVCPWPAGLRV